MYNEEELLEAIDILVEDYGFDEDYAIELVSETYSDEFYDDEELLEAVDILVEDYGIDEDYAIELVSEAYNEELLAEVSGKSVLGAGAAIAGTALLRKAYKNSKAPVHVNRFRLNRAKDRLQYRKDVKDYIGKVEASRRREASAAASNTDGRPSDGKSDYEIAKSIARSNKKANKRIRRAELGVERAERRLGKAEANYEVVQEKRQQNREKLKQQYADFKQARYDKKHPQPQRRFGFGRQSQPVRGSRYRRR